MSGFSTSPSLTPHQKKKAHEGRTDAESELGRMVGRTKDAQRRAATDRLAADEVKRKIEMDNFHRAVLYFSVRLNGKNRNRVGGEFFSQTPKQGTKGKDKDPQTTTNKQTTKTLLRTYTHPHLFQNDGRIR